MLIEETPCLQIMYHGHVCSRDACPWSAIALQWCTGHAEGLLPPQNGHCLVLHPQSVSVRLNADVVPRHDCACPPPHSVQASHKLTAPLPRTRVLLACLTMHGRGNGCCTTFFCFFLFLRQSSVRPLAGSGIMATPRSITGIHAGLSGAFDETFPQIPSGTCNGCCTTLKTKGQKMLQLP